jgi:hypothetical protein
MIYAVMDGSQTYQWGDSAIAAVVAILMVFLILGMIIAITHLVFKALGYLDIKKQVDAVKKSEKPAEKVDDGIKRTGRIHVVSKKPENKEE